MLEEHPQQAAGLLDPPSGGRAVAGRLHTGSANYRISKMIGAGLRWIPADDQSSPAGPVLRPVR